MGRKYDKIYYICKIKTEPINCSGSVFEIRTSKNRKEVLKMKKELIFDEMTELESEISNFQFFENELNAEELAILYSVMYQINKYRSLLG